MADRRHGTGMVVQNPQNPAEAFESFVALVRNSPLMIDVDSDLLFRHLAPFLANAQRDEPYVRELLSAIFTSRVNNEFGFLMRAVNPLVKFTRALPRHLRRLEKLESALKTQLQPGSVAVRLRPARFIEHSQGYGASSPKRFQIQIQTLVETPEDVLQAFSVEARIGSIEDGIEIDDLAPKSAFSSVAKKSGASTQVGVKRTESSGRSIGVGATGPGSKLTSSLQSSESLEQSLSLSDTAEETVSRVEHYLVARKIANKAWWHALAGIGPIDVEAGEYSVDCLIPEGMNEVEVTVEARVDWLHAGVVTARICQPLALPTPDNHPRFQS